MEKYMKSRLDFKKSEKADYIAIGLVILLTVVVFYAGFYALNKAIDRWALETCVNYNDCAEVIKTIK